MGFMMRAAVVIGVIYAASPVELSPVSGGSSLEGAKDVAVRKAVEAATQLCERDRAGCLAFGLQTLGQAQSFGQHQAAGSAPSMAPVQALARAPSGEPHTTASTRRDGPARLVPAANGRVPRL